MEFLGTPILEFLLDKHLAETISIGTAALFGVLKSLRIIISTLRERKLASALQEKIKEASRFYIPPYWSKTDPAHISRLSDEDGTRKKGLINHIEDSFKAGSSIKRIIILAGSGMGKTALLYNLYRRHLRKYLPTYDMILIELGGEKSFDKIGEIKNVENTVLLLDALDENSEALEHYEETIDRINKVTRTFYRVVITCRTQFFDKQEDVPKLLGFLGGVASAGDVSTKHCEILYVAPLLDHQVSWFLIKKYVLSSSDRSFRQYKKAKRLTKLVPDLVVRPMLLTYMDYILEHPGEHRYIYQLYESMIKGWLERRKSDKLDPNYKQALHFMYVLAIDIVRNYSKRSGYHISKQDALKLAHENEIALEEWQITGRSLLNIDINNRYKFSHLSFLEVLAARAIRNKQELGDWEPTAQTEAFLKEIVHSESIEPYADLSNLDLSGISIAGANLQEANLADSTLRRVDLKNVILRNANLAGADVEFEDLSSVDLEGANLVKSNLRGCHFSKNILKNIDFSGADLTGADFSFCEIEDVNAENAVFFGCDFTGTSFKNCRLVGANLALIRVGLDQHGKVSGPVFHDVNLDEAAVPANWLEVFRGTWAGTPIVDTDNCQVVTNAPNDQVNKDASR